MSALDFFDADDTGSQPASVKQLGDVMVDLETMGTRPNAPIIAIGAVTFDRQSLTIGQPFYRVVNLQSSVSLGAVIDADTVQWWMQQSDDARRAVTRAGDPVEVVLADFAQWLAVNMIDIKSRRVWACGTDFDCVILSEHYHNAGIELPWMFWSQRDYRTVRALNPSIEQGERKGHHNALDDAVFQTEHLFKIMGKRRVNS
jgi:DNA polymerase III epsilon subunit-like protein